MVEDELALFDKSINEFGSKFRSSLSDTPCQMVGLREACKDSVKLLTGTRCSWLKNMPCLQFLLFFYCSCSWTETSICLSEKLFVKLKEEERMVEMCLEYKNRTWKMAAHRVLFWIGHVYHEITHTGAAVQLELYAHCAYARSSVQHHLYVPASWGNGTTQVLLFPHLL